MTDQATTQQATWLNPAMLKWAREWRGRSIEEAAAKVKKTPAEVARWEQGETIPTVKQARMLADFYDRAFLELLLPAPPPLQEPKSIPDFRTHAGVLPSADSWEIKHIRQWAESQRENALDLFDALNEEAPAIPDDLFVTLKTNPSRAAEQTRTALKFSIHEQFALSKSGANELPTLLRQKLEQLGLLTLKHNALSKFGIRGICLALFPLPVIVFHNEAPTAQAFTLLHELGHVLLKTSGIISSQRSDYEKQPIERWCDRFAASFLMPEGELASIVGSKPAQPAPTIDDDTLKKLATQFRVSPHAMLIRLIHLAYVEDSYYWNVKRFDYEAEEATYKSFGIPRFYGRRYQRSLGDLYTGLVLEAWSAGHLTNHNAAEYMGIDNLSHLEDIREGFRQ
jgi:Zn-dependent peptidase ImmA (M78 family)/transcriptional regulator with XRE-family HTH domain